MVKKDVVKNEYKLYDKLVGKANNIYTSRFVLKTKFTQTNQI